MPTLAEIRQKADDWLTAKWPTLVARQDAYFAAKGRYWQGIRTPNAIPQDGADTAPVTNLKPAYQAEDWADVGLTAAVLGTLPMRLRIDQYDGPSGRGWVATATVVVTSGAGAGTYVRSRQVGPETWRTQAWTKVATGV